MTEFNQLLYNMAILAGSDISIDQGKVYNLNDKTIFYFNFFPPQTSYADYFSVQNLEHLSSLQKYSLVIADFSKERWGHYLLYDIFEQLGINFLLLTSDINLHQSRPKLLFYPAFYHWIRYRFQRQITTGLHKKHKLSCLNGSLRWHRVYNYLLLKCRPDFNTYLCSLHYEPDKSDFQEMQNRADLPDEVVQQWEGIKDQLPHRDDLINKSRLGKKITVRQDWDVSHPAFTDSYVNLVTETDVLNVFVTEKTWKPVASAQLFLIVGHRNAVAHLRDMGVDTFDDIIDHKYYDSDPNWQQRIQKVHKVLDQLLSQDLESLYMATQQRRTSNREKFFNGEFGAEYKDSFIKCINMLK